MVFFFWFVTLAYLFPAIQSYNLLQSSPKLRIIHFHPIIQIYLNFYLTSEYACGFERYELGFVKGKIDNGEAPKEACNRELKEEIGFGAKTVRTLKNEMTVAPGMLQLKMYTFLCMDLFPMQLEGDEPEPINIIKVSPREAKDLIFDIDSPLTEARAIASLTLAMNKLGML